MMLNRNNNDKKTALSSCDNIYNKTLRKSDNCDNKCTSQEELNIFSSDQTSKKLITSLIYLRIILKISMGTTIIVMYRHLENTCCHFCMQFGIILQ